MKKLDRYVMREMITPLLIGTAFVILLFQANILIALFKELNLAGVPPLAIAQYVLFRTPEFVTMTLPVGVAMAASLMMSRLVRDSELNAMRAAGVPIRRLLLPVGLMGLLVSCGTWFNAETLAPIGMQRARELMAGVGQLGVAPKFSQNVSLQIGQYYAVIGGVQNNPDRSVMLTDIMLIERRSLGEDAVIQAPKGSYRQGVWVIEQPTVRLFRGGTVVSVSSPGQMIINEKFALQDMIFGTQATEMSAAQLYEQIKQGRAAKQRTTELEVNFHSRFAVAAACLIFAITGMAMSVGFAKRGPFAGTLMSLVCAWLYFNAYIISTEVIGRNEWLPPIAAAWVPNAILVVISAVILWRAE